MQLEGLLLFIRKEENLLGIVLYKKRLMKYRHFINLALIFLLSVSLSGCLIYEQYRLKLDLSKMRGQIEYLNIVSTIEKKESYWENDVEKEEFFEELKQVRLDDLEELLEEYKEYSDSSNREVISKELIKRKDQLVGIEKFRINSLQDLEISTSSDGSKYFMKLDNDGEYIDGNGVILETDSGKYISWDKDVKTIDVTIKLFDLERDFDYTESMLSYWQQWKKNN